jgi:hypothetical protein
MPRRPTRETLLREQSRAADRNERPMESPLFPRLPPGFQQGRRPERAISHARSLPPFPLPRIRIANRSVGAMRVSVCGLSAASIYQSGSSAQSPFYVGPLSPYPARAITWTDGLRGYPSLGAPWCDRSAASADAPRQRPFTRARDAQSHTPVRCALLCPECSRLSPWSVAPPAERPGSTGWSGSRRPGRGIQDPVR